MKLQRVFVVNGKEVMDPAPFTGDIGTIQKILSSQFADILNKSYTVKIEGATEKYVFADTKVGTHG